jgi:hypothetical protein
MSTLFSNQNLTVVTAAAGGSQVQVPGQNVNLTADQTRQLAVAVAFVLATHSKGATIPSVAGIDVVYNEANLIEAPLTSPYTTEGVVIAVTLPNQTLYPTLLTIDQARQMSNAIAAYTVVG